MSAIQPELGLTAPGDREIYIRALIAAASEGTPQPGDRAVSPGLWFGPDRAERLRNALAALVEFDQAQAGRAGRIGADVLALFDSLFAGREDLAALRAGVAALADDHAHLHALINHPHTASFLDAVGAEMAYQAERRGEDDRLKTPEEWLWLVGYLANKALAAAKGAPLPRFRHVVRGSTYEVLSIGEDENHRGSRLVVYRGEDDGKVWVRPAEQFFDGRFEPLPATPQDKALHHCISTAAALGRWHAHLVANPPQASALATEVQRHVDVHRALGHFPSRTASTESTA